MSEAEMNAPNRQTATAIGLQHLQPFDESSIFDEYREIMTRSHEEQRQIYSEFKAFTDDVAAWVKAASQFDNFRSRKRIKTRLEWIKAKHGEIEGVRNEVVSCVEAVKAALSILGGITGSLKGFSSSVEDGVDGGAGSDGHGTRPVDSEGSN
ncbi:hypothetical protein POJ06DRAFT_270914 [Lipomyces tetrasporus]|uniref:Uncharacterized protein n=1 Tax=Lipomyces tetrasporus TaxID=54092 RepID=A0AAD7QL30_9ASCO|nr:uncharacterized protein POJ06DRAFT_270914 [Lipomyces tetrasporus]KAJ8097264.1 hypothetical protein POJ06DRAFT_270914 [Lipomyces tetrasporus]